MIVETVSRAVNEDIPEAVADKRPDWSRLRIAGLVETYRVALPDRATVEHHTSTPPNDHEPRVEAVADRDPDSATELHAFLDGMPVPAELTEVDPGRGWVLSDWRELAAEHAAAASPAAAELIRQLFREGESNEFVTA
ncbi:hypothetical protein [Saccharopolyspora pogona]|uniref:hypothetical protein n=1 Tax=Saccharopolyspora pogona TaxID=333966 RepID=UPI001681EA69|nr:hypothetical protein [Saccharopolyspora pogona]